MMANIHQKTHFKAAISVSRGDACCVKVEHNEFGDQFAEISRNIDAIHRSMKDFGHRGSIPGPGSRALQVGAFLQRKRTSASQGKHMGRLISGRSGISGRYAAADTKQIDKSQLLKQSGLQDEDVGDGRRSSAFSPLSEEDLNNMSQDEKAAALQMMSQDVSPEKVTK